MPRRDLIFRVFVSSTFSDFIAERNALQERTFPNLALYCQQKGARFQAIDLRWGVSEEAALDQQTMNICLQELQRCQRVSPRPNFIILLGDRYGWRPLPPQINAAEFEQLMERVKENNRSLLNQWYKRDDNAVPPEYCLQCRNTSARDGLSENEYREAIRKEADTWNNTEPQLHSLLLEAAQSLFQPGDSKLQKYEESATHQEIRRGAFQADNPHSHVFAYFRKIDGLPENVCAKDYRDIDVGKGTVDEDAYNRLQVLKGELRSLLSPDHDCEDIITHWQTNKEGVKPAELVSHNHLNDLCERVEKNLLKIIDREIGDFKEITELDREIEAHKTFCEQSTRCFIGRNNVLCKIRSYFSNSSNEPLVLYGVSGCGKTALMAKATDLAIQTQESDRVKGFTINVISRFIGATPESTDIRLLLASLCKQLSDVYHDEKPVPIDYQELLEDFSRLLHLSSPDKPLIILLDAIDQLSDSYQDGRIEWLPFKLPKHVKIIISLIPIESYFLQIEMYIPVQNLLELQTMPIEEGCALLDLWLKEAKRSLTIPQYDQIKIRFAVCGLPLYLKLAFEEARRWKSYTEPEQTVLNADVAGVFKDILDRFCLPVNHGKVIVSRSMGYLLAAKNGLTEDEIISVLSCDENVVGDFMKRSHPDHEISEFRLPVILWSRLYFDLEPYMAMRTADGTTVLAFFHRQLQTVAEEMFLQNSRRDRHVVLADYFEGILEKEKNRDRISDRRVVSELPYHLARGAKFKMLDKLLCDPHFLTATAKLGYTYSLPDDLGFKFERLSLDIPLDSLAAIIMNSWTKQLSVIEAYPDMAFQTLYNDIVQTGNSKKHSCIIRKWHDWALQYTQPYTHIWALMAYTYSEETHEDYQFETSAPVCHNQLSYNHIINICVDSLLTNTLCLKTGHKQSFGKLPFHPIGPVCLSPDNCRMLFRTAEKTLEGRETLSIQIISNNGGILLSKSGCDVDNHICCFLDSANILISRNGNLEVVNIDNNTAVSISTPNLIPRLCCIAPDNVWFAVVFDKKSGDEQKLSIYKWENQHVIEYRTIEIPSHILSIKYLFNNVVGWRDTTETITIFDIISTNNLLVRKQPCLDFDFDRSNNRLFWVDDATGSFNWCNLSHEEYHELKLSSSSLRFLRFVKGKIYLGSRDSIFRMDSDKLDKYSTIDGRKFANFLEISAVQSNSIITADKYNVFFARPGCLNTLIATSHHTIKNLCLNDTGDKILIQDSSGNLTIRDSDNRILSSINEGMLNKIKWYNNHLIGITQNKSCIKFIETNGKVIRLWPNQPILPQGKVNRFESVENVICDIEIRHNEFKKEPPPKNKLIGLIKNFKAIKTPANPVVDCAVLITHNGQSFVQIHTLNIMGKRIDEQMVYQISCADQYSKITLLWPFLFIENQNMLQVYHRLPEYGPIEKPFISIKSQTPIAIFHRHNSPFYITQDNNTIIFYSLETGSILGRLFVSHISQIHMLEDGILELKNTVSHSFFKLFF
jgi:hypothetical protein